MSSDISPSLVNWMTSMMTMRLQVILDHIPISQEQIQNYIVHTQVTDLTHGCVLIHSSAGIAPSADFTKTTGSDRIAACIMLPLPHVSEMANEY